MPSMPPPDASLPDVEWQGARGSLLLAGKRAGEQAVEFSSGNPLDLVARGSGLGCPASYSAGLPQLERVPSVLQ